MKRLLIDTLVLVLISLLLLFLIYTSNKYVFHKPVILAFGSSLVFVFFVFGITYKRLWSNTTNKVRMSILIFILFGVSSFTLPKVKQAYSLQQYLKNNVKRGWRGKAHNADKLLGFKPIPNSKAFHTFPIGEDIPMAYNEHGFRIPLSDTLLTENYDSLGLLFLGCSFTYGDACIAEHTFPYLLSEKTQMSYINAGVCSYGLAHMVLLAEELIPKYKPKFVVLQHSPWLINRGVQMFAPTYYGSLPNPYFYDTENNFSIHSPVFETLIFSIKNEQTIFDLFLYYVKEDFLQVKSKINIILNKTPKPTNNKEKAELYAYNKIIDLAKKEGSKVILLKMFDRENVSSLKEELNNDNVLFVDADAALFSPTKSDNYYQKRYGHWRLKDKDSILVDKHPNLECHKIISETIFNSLKTK